MIFTFPFKKTYLRTRPGIWIRRYQPGVFAYLSERLRLSSVAGGHAAICLITGACWLFAQPYALAQSSRDITAPITGAGSLRQQFIRATKSQKAKEEREKIRVTTDTAGELRGNLEVKTEIEEEIFSAKQVDRLGRIKTVFMQGHLNISELPQWWVFIHLAQEHLFTDGLTGMRQDRSNLIAEINPRFQKEFGAGMYGVEIGFASEARWEITRLRLRPFIEYWVSDHCRIMASVAGGYTFLELAKNEPDFIFASMEPGFSCATRSRMTVFGLYSKVQTGLNLNDDGGAINLDGTPVATYAPTKTSIEWRLSPFFHHRISDTIALTLWVELARLFDDAKNDNFFYQDFWQKLVAFIEYRVQRNFTVYGELNIRRGDRLFADAERNADAFGFTDDFTYLSVGGVLGINYSFGAEH
ncbi:MAG: OmpG porin family protein [Myxococcota bacterium]